MSMIPLALGTPSNQTGTVAVTTVPTVLTGFYVNSTSSGTIVFKDGGASGTVVTGTITPVIGWHFLPVSFPRSLHITIANTLDVTLIINTTPTS